MMIEPDDPRLIPVRTRKGLLADGWSDRAIAAAVRAGVLHRLRHGTYVDAAAWRRLDASAQHAVLARAVLERAQTGSVISHSSALPFYGAPVWGFDLDEVHLTREDHKAGRREAGVRQHRGRLVEGDVVDIDGLKVASPTRTALELTTLGCTEAALVSICFLLHQGLTTVERMRDRLQTEMDRWPSTLSTRVALRLADPRIETPGEARSLHLFWAQRLPMPIPQYEVRGRSGELIGRVDFAWPELGVFLEFDGRGSTSGTCARGRRRPTRCSARRSVRT